MMHAMSALLLLAASTAASEPHVWTYKGVQHEANLVEKNPTICETTPNVTNVAGKFAIDNGEKEYFYWAFGARTLKKDAPTLLWMTGGPGCSSSLALMVENGPCHVNKDAATTRLNPYSWNEVANVIYIDQPAGVGFSSGTMDDKDEHDVAENMYQFLQAFFKANPSWNTEFYVFGESYGGHYAPCTASRVFEGANAGEGIKINLAGLGVGNGLTDPQIQYKYYPEMVYNWSIEVQGKPVISEAEYSQWVDWVPGCIASIKKCNDEKTDSACDRSKDLCNNEFLAAYQRTGLNTYDITKPCDPLPLCYDFSAVNTYMNLQSTQEQIGVSKEWETCNYQVNGDFSADWMHNYQQVVPPMLEGGVRVLIYSGDLDFVCNWLGNKAWSQALPWSGHAAFNAAADNDWNNGAGKLRTAKGFSFMQVHKAGHMVPFDVPEAALQMVKDFVVDKKF
eukprot:TRINITY_DN2005_c0_g2_i5.p1 TRINITY_DN2005_c0_g2~~TRINITY_DN2005_c0_g2_i5.p1  ORF type:complete len:450 (+),score=220.19 TRINITY_DN2005_c0_g2_i5:49-1398(+)